MFKFETGKYYSSKNGKVIAQITKRTAKSVYINTHHVDTNEACVYLKRIGVDAAGDEYVITRSGVPVFAEFVSCREEFRQFINRNIGREIF